MTNFASDPQDGPKRGVALEFSTPPPPSVLVASFFQEYFGYHVRRPAGTLDWLIFYTTGGKGRCRMGSSEYVCVPGDVILWSPGSAHDYGTFSAAEPWEFYWSHFLPRPSWYTWLKLPEVAPGLAALSVTDPEAARRIEAAFGRLVQENAQKGAFQEDLAQNALEEALLLMGRLQHRQAPRPFDPRVAEVQDYLERHYNQPVTLNELAELVSLSSWRLSHLYKKQTGQTISQTLLHLRLHQAARLLTYTSRQITEIAGDVGFQSPFHFSRQFKDVFGLSPQVYRKQQWSADPSSDGDQT